MSDVILYHNENGFLWFKKNGWAETAFWDYGDPKSRKLHNYNHRGIYTPAPLEAQILFWALCHNLAQIGASNNGNGK